jgi:hypothetical protein
VFSFTTTVQQLKRRPAAPIDVLKFLMSLTQMEQPDPTKWSYDLGTGDNGQKQ